MLEGARKKQPRCAAKDEYAPQVWALRNYGSAKLPDARLNARLLQVASTLAARPGDSIPKAFDNWAAAKGTYRLIENKRVSVEHLQEPVFEATAKACAELEEVYIIYDTTSLNFTSEKTVDLGPVNDRLTARGMLLHSALAVRPGGGPVGILHCHSWTRDPGEHGKASKRRQIPIEEKESFKWLRGIEAVRQTMNRQHPDGAQRPRLIHVQDREGDIHEVLESVVNAGEGAVIRCAHNRRVKGPDGQMTYAHDCVRQSPVLGRIEVEVPRKEKKKKRTAQVELRRVKVTVMPPADRKGRREITLTLVELWEPDAPEGVTPLHWLLWTREQAQTLEQVLRVVDIYKHRWQIEEVHLALKSGCHIEKVQFSTLQRLRKILALYLPVAVLIVQLRFLAQSQPEQPCTHVFSEAQWQTLWTYFNRQRPCPNTPAPTLLQVVRWIGRLGGHLGRKGDGLPGIRALWKGWRELQQMAHLYEIMSQ